MEQEIPIIKWLLSGVIGAGIRDVYSVLVVKVLGLTKHYIWNWGAIIFLKEPDIHTWGGVIIGLTADLTISSALAIIICALIDWQKQRYYFIYGLIVSLGSWLVFFGIILHGVIAALKSAPNDVNTNLIAILGHVLFGLVTAFAYVKLHKSRYRKWS